MCFTPKKNRKLRWGERKKRVIRAQSFAIKKGAEEKEILEGKERVLCTEG